MVFVVVFVYVVVVVCVVVVDNVYFHVELYHQILILLSQQLHKASTCNGLHTIIQDVLTLFLIGCCNDKLIYGMFRRCSYCNSHSLLMQLCYTEHTKSASNRENDFSLLLISFRYIIIITLLMRRFSSTHTLSSLLL